MKTRQLLHAPSAILVAVTTVPVLFLWLKQSKEMTRSPSTNDIPSDGLAPHGSAFVFETGTFGLIVCTVIIIVGCIFYCVVFEDDALDGIVDGGGWTRSGRRGGRR